ncbi:hypothetical protein HPK19_03290 [Arthrobacter citreus]|nr:hypothetical protein HPK19_03290 [Arthrobacter citreus]
MKKFIVSIAAITILTSLSGCKTVNDNKGIAKAKTEQKETESSKLAKQIANRPIQKTQKQIDEELFDQAYYKMNSSVNELEVTVKELSDKTKTIDFNKVNNANTIVIENYTRLVKNIHSQEAAKVALELSNSLQMMTNSIQAGNIQTIEYALTDIQFNMTEIRRIEHE